MGVVRPERTISLAKVAGIMFGIFQLFGSRGAEAPGPAIAAPSETSSDEEDTVDESVA